MQQFEMTPAIAWLESEGIQALRNFSVGHAAPLFSIKPEVCWCMNGEEQPPIRQGQIEPDHWLDSPANTEYDDMEDELELTESTRHSLSRWHEEDIAEANAESPLLNNLSAATIK